jgi:predicted NACHT family NTPase
MSSIAEIEQAIAKLSTREFIELERWLAAERNRKWDQQIEADSASGALDPLLREVEEDVAKGRTRPTDELCDNS